MLLLSRQLREVITIGHEITVTVIEIRADKVRLGIEAPRDIGVHRQEIFVAIQREREHERRRQEITHDGGPDIADGAPSDGDLTTQAGGACGAI